MAEQLVTQVSRPTTTTAITKKNINNINKKGRKNQYYYKAAHNGKSKQQAVPKSTSSPPPQPTPSYPRLPALAINNINLNVNNSTTQGKDHNSILCHHGSQATNNHDGGGNNSPREKLGLNSPRQQQNQNDENISDCSILMNNDNQCQNHQESDNVEIKEDQQQQSLSLNLLKAPWKKNKLLPPLRANRHHKKCLVLDLDETLVHSSFQPVECDFVISIDIEGFARTIYVSKRPHVDEFLKACGELFEVAVFTASLAKYADPLLDILDIHKVIEHRLFRESCTMHLGTYAKDLFRIGRPLASTIIIDNSPHSYVFNPANALPCESWFDDQTDTELLDLLTILERLAEPSVIDVMSELDELSVSGLSLVPEPAVPPPREPDTDEE